MAAFGALALGDLVSEFRVDLRRGMTALGQIPAEMRRVEQEANRALDSIAARGADAARKLGSSLSSGLDKVAEFTRQHRAQILAIGAATAAASTKAVMAYANWEEASKNVQNITGITTAELEGLQARLLELPPAIGRPTDLMKSLYQVLSSGVPKDNALDFLVANAKAARGNLADLTQTVNASTSVMAAYGLEASELNNVLDAMTKTVDLGKLTFNDLADNIGKGISIAASAGVEYEELLATLATLTLGGLSVEESMTAMRNIIVATISPSAEAAKVIAETGLELNVAALQSKGLAAVMGDVAKAVEGNQEAVAALFPNIRAMNGAMALASEQGGARLNETLEAIQGSAGKVEANFANMVDSVKGSSAELAAVWEKTLIDAGKQLQEAVLPILRLLTELLDGFNELPEPMRAAAAGMVALTTVLAGLALAISPVMTVVKAVGGTFTALGVAGGAGAVGVGALATAVGALTAALGILAAGAAAYKLTGWIMETTGAADALREAFGGVAHEQSEYQTQLVEDARLWEMAHKELDNIRKALNLTGEEWQISTDRTADNAAKMAVMLDRARALHAEYRAEQKTLRERNDAIEGEGDALDQVKEKLGEYDKKSAESAEKLKKAYGFFTGEDVVQAAEALADKVKTLAENGVPAAEMFEAMRGELDGLNEHAANFESLELPHEFDVLKDALEGGIEQFSKYINAFNSQLPIVRMTVEEQMTAMAASLQLSMDRELAGGFQQSMLRAVDSGKTEVEKLQQWLKDHPLEAELMFNMEDLKRALQEAGLSPNTGGVLP